MRIVFIIILIALQQGMSQQDNQYTQYSQTKLYYNSAYAGQEDQYSITGRHRNQWSGLVGGPAGQALLVNFPTVHEVLGFGLSINRNSVGIQERSEVAGMYSYKLKIKEANLNLGLQASFRQFVNDFTKDGLIAIDGFELDPSISRERYSTNVFNVGAGLFFNTKRFYLGVSVPRLVKADIDAEGFNSLSQETRHLYAMFGLNFELSPFWSIQQNNLFKYSDNAPFDIDSQAIFVYQRQVHLGLNLRAGGSQSSILESTGMILGFQFTPRILASMSYDFNTTELREYENGSFEILIKYEFLRNKSPKLIQNPRYY